MKKLILFLLLTPILLHANFLTFTDSSGMDAKPRHIYFDSVTTFYYSMNTACTFGDSCFVQISVYGKEKGLPVGSSVKRFFMTNRLNDPQVKPLWMTFPMSEFRNDDWMAKKDSIYLIQISISSRVQGSVGTRTDTISTYPDKKPPVSVMRRFRNVNTMKFKRIDLLGRVK